MLRVLVVDDEPDNASTLSTLLRLYGYEVEVAVDGPSALQMARWGIMMRARDCFNCGKPAEPPFRVARLRLLPPEFVSRAESLGMAVDSDGVFCTDCLDDWRAFEAAKKKVDEEIRSGSRCYVCCDELKSPGGTTIWLNGTLRLVCPKCKSWVMYLA